jgi:serine/threonine protein kinase
MVIISQFLDHFSVSLAARMFASLITPIFTISHSRSSSLLQPLCLPTFNHGHPFTKTHLSRDFFVSPMILANPSPAGRCSSINHFKPSADTQTVSFFHPQITAIPNRIGPYELRGTIGEGSFSLVKLAYRSDTNAFFACKVLNRKFLHDQELYFRFESEIRVHQQLHHPSVVALVDLLEDRNYYYVVMEFCAGGELFQYIVSHERLAESQAKPLIQQILQGIGFLHMMGVSHRDLKPENLLLSTFGDVKISDFGLSRFVRKDGLVETPCGSPCYASPECLSGSAYDGRATDCWSVGVVLFTMVTGQLPWTKRNQKQLFEEIRTGSFTIPSTIGRECQGLIRGLMTVDYRKRLTAEMALRHPFFATNPPQAFSTLPGQGFVSLKRVDEIFGAGASELVLPVSVSGSQPGKGFDEILKDVKRTGVKAHCARR